MKNIDQNRKYLFVEPENVQLKEYKSSDSTNEICSNMSEFFEINKVPKKYRKIIIKINIPLLSSKVEAEEFFTQIGFDCTGHTRIKRKDPVKTIVDGVLKTQKKLYRV